MCRNCNPFTKTRLIAVAFFLIGLVTAPLGCTKEKEVECPEPPKPKPKPAVQKPAEQFMEIIGGPGEKGRSPKDYWCRTCVMGPKGWASCQTAHSDSETEKHEIVKERSRQKACDDAGFEKGRCPDSAVLNIVCKGDKPLPLDGNKNSALGIQKVFYKERNSSPQKKESPAVEPKP